jgi:protein-S-isoprenylcysteine O-methyltransferase Ste14
MIAIGNFFFKYRNLLFPIIILLIIFISSPSLFTEDIFGSNYYLIPLIMGIAIALFGQVVRAITIGLKYIVRGGKNKEVYADDLVTEGIFNHCRNPLYVGNILMVMGAGLISNSLIFILIVVPLFCFIYQAIVLAEENYLRNKFGDHFKVYCNRVNRWIPNFTGLSQTITSMKFDWRKYVRTEYNTVYLLFLSIYIFMVIFVPPLVIMEQDSKVRLSIVVVGILSAIYLIVRYLKKSKKLNSTIT